MAEIRVILLRCAGRDDLAIYDHYLVGRPRAISMTNIRLPPPDREAHLEKRYG